MGEEVAPTGIGGGSRDLGFLSFDLEVEWDLMEGGSDGAENTSTTPPSSDGVAGGRPTTSTSAVVIFFPSPSRRFRLFLPLVGLALVLKAEALALDDDILFGAFRLLCRAERWFQDKASQLFMQANSIWSSMAIVAVTKSYLVGDVYLELAARLSLIPSWEPFIYKTLPSCLDIYFTARQQSPEPQKNFYTILRRVWNASYTGAYHFADPEEEILGLAYMALANVWKDLISLLQTMGPFCISRGLADALIVAAESAKHVITIHTVYQANKRQTDGISPAKLKFIARAARMLTNLADSLRGNLDTPDEQHLDHEEYWEVMREKLLGEINMLDMASETSDISEEQLI
ncbi:hypothetical protein C8J57DRAFT_1478651 [Mycena rebaudengoi]|nr:hypothetical protein C8J57DRAFT_1478651 [Mycena rebaudengoi]